MRKYKRSIARKQMIDEGFTKLNKKYADRSLFSINWKEAFERAMKKKGRQN